MEIGQLTTAELGTGNNEIALSWMPQNKFDESQFFHVMPRCHIARPQAITWANVDPDPCHHMASLSRNELI